MPSFALNPNAYIRVCFYQGCGSAAPHPYKRLSPEIKARSHGIFSDEDAKATCRHGERVCGVYDGSDAFECLNTDIALESCKCRSQRTNIYLILTLFQVVGACRRTRSSTSRNKALRASTARLSRTCSTFAAPAVAVLSTAAKQASSRLPIVRNVSVSTISRRQGSIRYKLRR